MSLQLILSDDKVVNNTGICPPVEFDSFEHPVVFDDEE